MKKYVNLEDIITFSLGKNVTRLRDTDNNLYTPNDFEDDLHCINDSNGKGCIINLIKSKAAPLTSQNEKKCFTSNFLKCEFDANILDPWYFCYQFNSSKSFEQQLAMIHQGYTLSVRKLNIKNISELKIYLASIEKQRAIGELYKKMIVQTDLMNKQVENYSELLLDIISRYEED